MRHVQMRVLRQLPDLFRGHILEIWVNKRKNRMDRDEFMACLDQQFRPIRPFHHIKIVNGNLASEMHIDELLRQPMILNCPRLALKRWLQPRVRFIIRKILDEIKMSIFKRQKPSAGHKNPEKFSMRGGSPYWVVGEKFWKFGPVSL